MNRLASYVSFLFGLSLLLFGCGSDGALSCPSGQVECGGTCVSETELTDGPQGVEGERIAGSCALLCGEYEIDMDAPIVPRSPIRELTRVEIGDDLHLRVDGEPFFPIGMWDMTTDVFGEASRAGFTMAGPFHDCCANGNLDEHLDYIERAADVGLHSFLVPLPWSSTRTDPFVDLESWYGEDLDTLESWITTRASTPGFLGWMSWDEPQLNNTNRSLMAAVHPWLKTVDPDHPDALVDAPITIAGPTDYAELADMTDIHMTDPYPWGLESVEVLARLGVTNWLPGDSVSKVRSDVPDKPAWAVLQAHDQLPWLCDSAIYNSIVPACTENVDEEGRYVATSGPPAEVMRNHAFQAIAKGASGILWYSYDPSTKWRMPDYPEQFEELKEIAGDIWRIAPALLSEDRTPDVEVLSASAGERPVSVRAQRINASDASLLILTNPLDEPAFVELDLSAWGDSQCVGDLEAKTGQLPFQGGTIRVELEPLEVRLLQVGPYTAIH